MYMRTRIPYERKCLFSNHLHEKRRGEDEYVVLYLRRSYRDFLLERHKLSVCANKNIQTIIHRNTLRALIETTFLAL